MREYRFTPLAVALSLMAGVAVVGGGYAVSKKVAEDTAREVSDEAIATSAELAAKDALKQELVKEEFLRYFVDKVKERTLPRITETVKEVAFDYSADVDDKYKAITDQIRTDLNQVTRKTDEIVDERMDELRQEDIEIRGEIEESQKSIHDFIKLTLTDLVPSGCISAFFCSTDSPPPGWLVCDGTVITSNPDAGGDARADVEYERLVDVLNTIGYGEGEDRARVPDLRGYFLRGVEGNRRVGDFQQESVRRHKHPVYSEAQSVGRSLPEMERGAYRNYLTEIRNWSMPAPAPVFKDTEFQGISSDDHRSFEIHDTDETRPKNIAVVWCIKI